MALTMKVGGMPFGVLKCCAITSMKFHFHSVYKTCPKLIRSTGIWILESGYLECECENVVRTVCRQPGKMTLETHGTCFTVIPAHQLHLPGALLFSHLYTFARCTVFWQNKS